MRGGDQKQTAMYSYVTLTQRIPADHSARQIRAMVDRALERLEGDLEQLYSTTGRPSIAPEARLYQRAAADKSVPSYQGRSVSAGRQNGLRRRNENRKPAAQPAGGTKKSLRKSTRAEKHEFFRSL